MAKLGSFYGLCPIIDEKSLLGINEDVEAGTVIVTLGKNIAIKYKIADQKQMISWRTKDKFTSPVIYYKEEDKYCCAFNLSYIRIWNSDVENLDKQKKYKFNKQIFTLLKHGDQSFIIFTNGCISSLSYALENRKEYTPADVIDIKNESIINILQVSIHNKIYIGLLIQGEDENEDKILVWTTFSKDKFEEYQRIPLAKPNLNLMGCVLTTHLNDEVHLLTLWSDGKMWLYPLEEDNIKKDDNSTFYSMIRLFSNNFNVKMVPLNRDYIAMYGADHNQEGASLIIYNLQFQTLQSKQGFKMFTNTTNLWCLENNLFLCVGQNLAVVPYHLDTEQLAALIGSHRAQTIDEDIEIIQDLEVVIWEKDKKKNIDQNGNDLSTDIVQLCEQGWSEFEICNKMFPKYIEENDTSNIEMGLKHFTDIPESCIVDLLNFVLNANANIFKSKETNSNINPQLAPMDRCHLIDMILMHRYSDVVLLPFMCKINLTNSILLLEYVSYLLSENNHLIELDGNYMTNQLLLWGSVILDANYQKLLITSDEKMFEIIKSFKNVIDFNLKLNNDLYNLDIDIKKIKSTASTHVKKNNSNYFIEKLKLY